MARFLYQCRDGRGQLLCGSVTATTPSDAARQLRTEGKFVLEVKEAAGSSDARPDVDPVDGSIRVRRDEVVYFTHQMAVMIETGVSMSEALESLAQQTTSEAFKTVLENVARAVEDGDSFSVAIARHPRAFPPLMVSLLKASEASGTLAQMLERLSVYLAKERRTMRQVRGAMAYPCFLVTMAVMITLGLMIFIMPRFTAIYASRGATLPLPTRILLGMSNALVGYWWIWLIAAVVGGVGLRIFLKSGPGRESVDWLKIRMPVLGPMYNQLYLTRAMRTMSTMIASGVPMLEMLNIARDVTDNIYYKRLWDRCAEMLRSGSQLSDPLFETDLIPKPITRMIHSGEKAGRLAQVMNSIADFAEQDLDESVKRTTQFVEPVMIGVMGTIVGFVAISLMLPIFSISRVVAGQ